MPNLGSWRLTIAGPNAFNISNEVPNGCKVDQAVYISRHGSRYPDPGAYNGWVELYERVESFRFPRQFLQSLTKT